MDYYSYPDEPAGPNGWLFVLGLAAGALLVATTWLVSSWTPWDADGADGRGRIETSSAQGSTRSAEVDPVGAACRDVALQQADVLEAGRPALGQWKVHIGAMNKLVTGAISLEQATAFWDETRVGAQRRLDRYQAALHRFDTRLTRCPRGATAAGAATDAQCVEAAQAGRAPVRLLRGTLATWQTHVNHMEMLRHGHMSPARATELWLAAWRDGLAQVRRYEDAAEKGRASRCPA